MKKKVFEYISEQYGVEPDYPWDNFSDYAVFRHRENQKWFALVMRVGFDKLGINKEGSVDVVNLRIADAILHDELIHETGIFPSYHMNKRYWITVLLDGTVPREQVFRLIDLSFDATNAKSKRSTGA